MTTPTQAVSPGGTASRGAQSEARSMAAAAPCHVCGRRPFLTAGGRLEIVHDFRLHYPERCHRDGETHSVRDRYDPEARHA